MMQKSIYSRRFDMSVGRIELVEGKKEYIPYASLGGGVKIHKIRLLK